MFRRPGARERTPPPRATLADAGLAAAFLAVAQVDVWAPHLAVWGDDAVLGSQPLNAVLLGLVALPLAWRRRAPLAAVTVLSGAVAGQALLTGTPPIGLLLLGPVLIGLYFVAAYGDQRQAAAGLAVIAAAVAVHDVVDPNIRTPRDVEGASWWWLVLLVGWLVGRYVGSRRAAVALRRRAEELARERLEAETAVREERARIARELHDVVAHSVSVVAVQAGAALSVLDHDPGRAHEPLAAIETTARGALGEMRRLLGVLRAEDGEVPAGEIPPGASLTPQPGVHDLPAMVGQLRDAGLPVEYQQPGAHGRIPPGVDLAVYRIVQEALTNVLKHAGPVPVRVVVTHRDDAVELSVVDEGRVTDPGRGGGHGLVGMRERVALYGGRLTAGPRPGGGYAVSAVLPTREVR